MYDKLFFLPSLIQAVKLCSMIHSRAWDRQRSTFTTYAQVVFSVCSTFVDAMAYDFSNLMELLAGPQSRCRHGCNIIIIYMYL